MKINILVIEDMEEDARLIKVFLKQASLTHNFYYAETLIEGVETCKENEIDIVLLSLNLPDSRGRRTLRLFSDMVPDIPVIILGHPYPYGEQPLFAQVR